MLFGREEEEEGFSSRLLIIGERSFTTELASAVMTTLSRVLLIQSVSSYLVPSAPTA